MLGNYLGWNIHYLGSIWIDHMQDKHLISVALSFQFQFHLLNQKIYSSKISGIYYSLDELIK